MSSLWDVSSVCESVIVEPLTHVPVVIGNTQVWVTYATRKRYLELLDEMYEEDHRFNQCSLLEKHTTV